MDFVKHLTVNDCRVSIFYIELVRFTLVLTDYKLGQLRAAYEKSINGTAASQYEQEENVLYGTYEPLSVTLTHIINNRSGISFTSYSHTGLPVAVLAHGVNAGQFNGYYDNTQIYHKLAGMLGVA